MSKSYWMINSRWEVKEAPAEGPKYKERKKVGNYFKEKGEAKAIADAIKRLGVSSKQVYKVYLREPAPQKDSDEDIT